VKRLIVNADDLGADDARNAGIFEAIRRGSVTSVSILPNGPALEVALREMQSLPGNKVSWGIHLNLSEGTPLCAGLRLLTDKEGCFLGKARAHGRLMRQGDADLEEEVQREVEAQIQVLQKAGIRISHLDGHQHVHVFPAVVRAGVQAAREHRIPWVRIPEEKRPGPGAEPVPDGLAAEAENFNRLAQEAWVQIKDSGVRMTDNFRGLYLKGRMDRRLIGEFLGELPPGLTEFMVHPGRVPVPSRSTPFSAFSTGDRERELETLLSEEFREALAGNGIELTPFPEAGN
jgi:chitin disaccharide deacetylase